jgi:protein-tyrosine kinase
MNRPSEIGSTAYPAPVLALNGERQIGALLVDAGKITPEDAERVLRMQKEKGLRFGEAAVRLGLVSETDIQQVLSTQFEYPYLHSAQSGVGAEVVAAYEPFSKQVELLRALRSQLMLRWFGPERRLLAVSSPGRRDGRSYLAANLAVVFSQLGERTLLIDADMRHSRQHGLFGLPNKDGLSTVLSGRSGSTVRRIPGLLDLSVLTAGPTPPNPQELLGREGFASLLEDESRQFDVVIIDTPAAEASADAQRIAYLARGTLLVGRLHRTRLREMEALSASIASAGAEVVGTVLNTY